MMAPPEKPPPGEMCPLRTTYIPENKYNRNYIFRNNLKNNIWIFFFSKSFLFKSSCLCIELCLSWLISFLISSEKNDLRATAEKRTVDSPRIIKCSVVKNHTCNNVSCTCISYTVFDVLCCNFIICRCINNSK